MLYIGNVNPELIEPVIERMLRSADDEARHAGGSSLPSLRWTECPDSLRKQCARTPLRDAAQRMYAQRESSELEPRVGHFGLAIELMDRPRRRCPESGGRTRDKPSRKAVATFRVAPRGAN